MPKPPVWFSRLESSDAIQRPVLGTAGTTVGTLTYSAGKFGNGVGNQTTANYYNCTPFTQTVVNTAWTVKWWYIPGYSSGAAGFYDMFGLNGTSDEVQMYYDNRFPRVTVASGGGLVYTFSSAWITSGSFYRVSLVYQASNVGAKMRLFVDDVEKAGTAVSDTSLNFGSAATYKCTQPGDSSNAVHDNIQFFDYVDTDQKRMWGERGCMNDKVFST